jgi:proteasome lid subunit RPN8/RPN11
MLTLPDAVVDTLAAWARAGYPGETCGLLFARGEEVRAEALPNIADRLHELDPQAYPRTSRNYFAFNEAKAARLVREAAADGWRWLAIWHSYFSAEDIATAAPGGQCVYPDLFQLVIDVRADGCREAKAFRWDGAAFAPVATFPQFRSR